MLLSVCAQVRNPNARTNCGSRWNELPFLSSPHLSAILSRSAFISVLTVIVVKAFASTIAMLTCWLIMKWPVRRRPVRVRQDDGRSGSSCGSSSISSSISSNISSSKISSINSSCSRGSFYDQTVWRQRSILSPSDTLNGACSSDHLAVVL